MPGASKYIADLIRADITSSTASGVVASYPTIFTTGASAVPQHLYMCAKDIWLTGTSITATWSTLVVDVLGLGYSGPNSIEVITIREMNQEDSPLGPKSNTIGAKCAEVMVCLKVPDRPQTGDSTRFYEMGRRLERILDYNYRLNLTRRVYPAPTDYTLNPNANIEIYWDGFANGLPINNAKYVGLVFYVYYSALYLI